MALEKRSRLTQSIVIKLPINKGFQVTEVKLCVGHSWRLSSLNLEGLMVMTYAGSMRNFEDLRIDHHSNPASEIFTNSLWVDRLQYIPCSTYRKISHPLNFLKPCNVLIFLNFLKPCKVLIVFFFLAYQAPLRFFIIICGLNKSPKNG